MVPRWDESRLRAGTRPADTPSPAAIARVILTTLPSRKPPNTQAYRFHLGIIWGQILHDLHPAMLGSMINGSFVILVVATTSQRHFLTAITRRRFTGKMHLASRTSLNKFSPFSRRHAFTSTKFPSAHHFANWAVVAHRLLILQSSTLFFLLDHAAIVLRLYLLFTSTIIFLLRCF